MRVKHEFVGVVLGFSEMVAKMSSLMTSCQWDASVVNKFENWEWLQKMSHFMG